jgi:hypothetical protein
MAHFCEVDSNNTVLRVLVVPDEQEHRGQEYLADELGLGGVWLQTSYNARIRKNYAGINYTYDPIRDAFIAPKPYESWLLDEETCQWKAPVEMPTDDKMYVWDETSVNWVEQ